jgi:hypothetical protein
MDKETKLVLCASLIFFILLLFAFPELNFIRTVALSLILGLFGQTFAAIEQYLKNINERLNNIDKLKDE